MKRALLAVLFLLLNNWAQAQLSEKGTAPSLNLPAIQEQLIDSRTLPPVPISKLHQEDARDALEGVPPRFGHPFKTKLNLENSGTWSTLPNGDKIWRLRIECPGAHSINLLYDKFRLPEGAQFFIYNREKNHQLGAFTDRNNKSDGKFGTGLVYGDHITLEYFLPKTARYQGELEVSTIVHGYKTIQLAKDFEDAAACNVDTKCDNVGREDQIKSVALMLLGGTRWCTGSLITNIDEDCKPLFLTSNICLNNYDAIDSPQASGFTFYWNYESPTCGGVDGPTDQSTTGAIVLANSGATSAVTASDFALLELEENPADNYDVFFAGWDANDVLPPSVYTVHHPSGDVKKISVDNGPLFESGFAAFGGDTHWLIFAWESGIMENGSLGAPLFLPNGRIVGTHSGGLSNCGSPQEDYFGQFTYSWLNNGATEPRRRLKDWLDPSNIGTLAIDGSYSPCNPRPIISFATTSLSTKEGKNTLGNGCLSYEEFTIALQTTAAPLVPITVDLSISGTAKEGNTNDFEVSPRTVTFGAGSSADQLISIRVFDDAYIEGIEKFELSYSLTTSGRGVSAMSDNVFTGTIADDDLPPHLAGPSTPITLVSEDFEDGAFPPDWTKSTQGTDSLAYKWGTAQDIGDVTSFFTVNPSNSTNMVGSNDDVCNCDMSEDLLISPVFDLSLISYGAASVTYDVYFEDLTYQGFEEFAEVYGTNDGGATWVKIDDIPGVGADGPWQTRTADLSEFIGDATVQVMFRYSDNGGFLFGVAFDNISVVAEDRGPTDIQVPDNPVSLDEEYLGPNETVHFYDEVSGDLMVTIENLSAHDYGCTSVEVDRSGTPYVANEFNDPSVLYYLASKTFLVTPAHNNPNGEYKITLFYTEEELAGYEAFTGQSRNFVQIVKANTNISTVTPSNYGNYDIENKVADISPYTNSVSGTNFGFTNTFNTGFSGFGLGILDPLLPVTITAFSGTRQRNTALLTWETEAEVNNDFFTLERSADGINFSHFTTIDGAGNSNSPISYEFIDERPLQGKNYYRLSHTDLEGKTEYVDIVLVAFDDLSTIELYPNPVDDKLELAFVSAEGSNGKLELFDTAGRLLLSQDFTATLGTNRLEVDMAHRTHGVYFVSLHLGTVIKVRRVVK